MIGIVGLLILLVRILFDGIDWLSWHFLTNFPSRHPEIAGMKSAIFGTIWTIGLTGAFTVPIGIGAAIYLEEYCRTMIAQEESDYIEMKKLLKDHKK